MRFRLLSYVATILLLSGMVGVNLTPVKSTRFGPVQGWGSMTHSTRYGWPFVAWASELLESQPWIWREVPVDSEPVFTSGLPGRPPPVAVTYSPQGPSETWYYRNLAFNIAIGLTISIAGLLACEFVLRR